MLGNLAEAETRADRDLGAWRRHRGVGWVALVAATLLFAQAIFGALASGASAAPAQLDAFGRIICTSQGAERNAGAPAPTDQHHLPDCCLQGCSVLHHAALPAPDLGGGLQLPAQRGATRIVVETSGHYVPDRAGSPAKPRAPPVNA